MARKSKAVVRKHQVRALKHQPERNGANEMKANRNGSASRKKRSEKLSRDCFGSLLPIAATKCKDLMMNMP